MSKWHIFEAIVLAGAGVLFFRGVRMALGPAWTLVALILIGALASVLAIPLFGVSKDWRIGMVTPLVLAGAFALLYAKWYPMQEPKQPPTDTPQHSPPLLDNGQSLADTVGSALRKALAEKEEEERRPMGVATVTRPTPFPQPKQKLPAMPVERIEMIDEGQVAPRYPDLRFARKLVFQVNTPITGLALLITSDKPIGMCDPEVSGYAMTQAGTVSGAANGHPELFYVKILDPPVTPNNPLTLILSGKEEFHCTYKRL